MSKDRKEELISMESIVGSLLGGFAVKLAGAAAAIWLAIEVASKLRGALAPISAVLGN